RLCGLAWIGAVAFAIAALATWNVADPSLSHATGNVVTNAVGFAGAIFADLAMQFLGLGAVMLVLPGLFWGLALMFRREMGRKRMRAIAWLASCIFFAAAAACFPPPASWPLPTGLGGVIGDLALKLPQWLLGRALEPGMLAMSLGLLLLAPAAWLFLLATGIAGRVAASDAHPPFGEDELDEVVDDGEGRLERLLGAGVHLW